MKVIGGAFALLYGTARAALSTDPFVYDPQFNGGLVIEDRFAATTLDTSYLGLRVAVGTDGSIVASGIVGPEYQAAAPPGNFGLVRYGTGGERSAWANPTPAYSYYYNFYVDYPNILNAATGWVRDLKLVDGFLYALVDLNLATGHRDVRIFTFSDADGSFVADTGAFTTPLDETGAALVPYCHHNLVVNGQPVMECSLIAVANYATGSGRQVITMKRFSIGSSDGSLTVDNTFGISNNGAMDQTAPDTLCTAGTGCSWTVAAATALRTADDNNPTLYLAGTVQTSSAESDSIVVAVNGFDGGLASSFGGGSGYYVNYLGSSSFGTAIAAATSGAAATDTVFLGLNTPDGCGQKSAITKLIAQLTLPVGTSTYPDFNWGIGGTRDVGGNSGSCGNVYTYLSDMTLDGQRLVLVGYEDLNSSIPDPLFAIVRRTDGALTEFARAGLTPMRADNTPWGGAAFRSVAPRGGGRYAVTGYLYDAAAGGATLFGTASLISDRIFGDDFEGN